jgi:hypothetical protein
MRRVIVKISAFAAACSASDRHDLQWERGVYALCDDGTVWHFSEQDPTWYQLPDIPQPEGLTNG